MKTLIVIPTYNEAHNIESFLSAVDQAVSSLSATDILVVDDNSPDNTGNIVKKIIESEAIPGLNLLQREGKLGLGTAYIDGFKWGMSKEYDVFVEMDADFSHDPQTLPAMLNRIIDCDFIVGSRYIRGGGVVGWGMFRKFISVGGSLYARMILGVPIRDLTGGYNVWTKQVLMDIGLDMIQSEGYAFQIELKYRAFIKDYSCIEYPIVFKDRMSGKSKMSRRIFIEAMYRVWQLKFSKL